MGRLRFALQVGFLVRTENGHVGADLQECLPDYRLAFEGQTEDRGACFYYTCRQTAHLDEEYGDLLSIIHDFEVSGLKALQARMLGSRYTLPLPDPACLLTVPATEHDGHCK